MFFLSRLLPGWECEGCGSELYWKTQLLCWGWFPLYLSSLSRCKPTQTSLLRFDTWVLRRFHVLHYLKKVVGGRKQRSAERAHTEAHTQTHTLASRREERQNVRAGSGRVLPVLPSAWRLPRRRVASRRPPRLNSLKCQNTWGGWGLCLDLTTINLSLPHVLWQKLVGNLSDNLFSKHFALYLFSNHILFCFCRTPTWI